MFNRLPISINAIILLLLIVVFIIVKIPYLSLPYYWDEAWVYGSAIRTMEATKLSLFPDALPVQLSRGHPLLFHFAGAIWLRIFGTSLFASHIFALLISIAFIVLVYWVGKKVFSERVGIIACIFLLLQPIFQAQSVLVLPEIMLSLLSLLTIYFFIKDNWVGYVIAGTLTLLTKETGLVAIATIALWEIIDTFILKRNLLQLKTISIRLLIIISPLFSMLIFIGFQKHFNGWYFYPEHIDFLSTDLKTFGDRFVAFSAQLFVYWGKNLLTVGIIISLFLFFYFKIKLNSLQSKCLLLLSIYIMLFLIVSAVNFYSDRYIMSMVGPFCIIAASLLTITFTKRLLLNLFICIYASIQLFMYLPQKTSSDHNLGYADCVKVHQQMVNYCVDNNLMNSKIFTHFLMKGNLTNPYCGYITENLRFESVGSAFEPDIEFFIFNNMEGRTDYLKMKNTLQVQLLKRFELNRAWSEIYQVNK